MAYLSRIIFIESATMRREEIIVNSNNHIYGTQGAGKTTIEKAVNFFYTARKPQSSNDPGKKSFEDFYFPHSYSYIIYEVDRSGDNGKFCVIVYKDGRVMFRFVDAPYDQYWLVDPETKEPRHRPELVQKALAEKGILNFPVKTYENYRNVLYGRYSNDVPRKDFERFLIDRNDDPAGYANVLNSMFASDRINTETLLRMVINSEKGGSGREGHDTTMARIDIARIRDLLKDYRMVNSNIEKWTDENGSVYRNTSNAIEALKQLSGYSYLRTFLSHGIAFVTLMMACFMIAFSAQCSVLTQYLLVIGEHNFPAQLVMQQIPRRLLDKDVFGIVVAHGFVSSDGKNLS